MFVGKYASVEVYLFALHNFSYKFYVDLCRSKREDIFTCRLVWGGIIFLVIL